MTLVGMATSYIGKSFLNKAIFDYTSASAKAKRVLLESKLRIGLRTVVSANTFAREARSAPVSLRKSFKLLALPRIVPGGGKWTAPRVQILPGRSGRKINPLPMPNGEDTAK